MAHERGKVLQGTQHPRKEPHFLTDDHYRISRRHHLQTDEPRFYGGNQRKMVCTVYLLLESLYGTLGFSALFQKSSSDAQICAYQKSPLLRQALFTTFYPFVIMAKIMKKEILSYDLQYNFGRFR